MTAMVTVSEACPGGFQKDVMGLAQAEVLVFSGTGVWVEPLGTTGWVGSGGWYLASICRATAELCSLGLGAMAEVSTIVDKVKEVLSQHAGFQQS